MSVNSVFRDLPIDIQALGVGFLRDLQGLHDIALNWNEKGLTKGGERFVTQIKKYHELNF